MAARRLIVGGVAAALTAAALLLGGVLADRSAPTAASAVPLASGIVGESDAALLPRLQQQVREKPTDVRGPGLLGLAYQQRARETGDPAYYGSPVVCSAALFGSNLRTSSPRAPRLAGAFSTPLPGGAGARPPRGLDLAVHGPRLRRDRRCARRARSL